MLQCLRTMVCGNYTIGSKITHAYFIEIQYYIYMFNGPLVPFVQYDIGRIICFAEKMENIFYRANDKSLLSHVFILTSSSPFCSVIVPVWSAVYMRASPWPVDTCPGPGTVVTWGWTRLGATSTVVSVTPVTPGISWRNTTLEVSIVGTSTTKQRETVQYFNSNNKIQ